MRISIIPTTRKTVPTLAVDLLVIPVRKSSKRLGGMANIIDKTSGGLLSELIVHEHFEGNEGDVISIRTKDAIGPTAVLLIGAGEMPFTSAMIRKLAARSINASRRRHAKTVAFLLPEGIREPMADVTEAATEGAILGDYRFLDYKDKERKERKERDLDSFGIITPDGKKSAAAEKGVRQGEVCSRATILARDMVNAPAAEITPAALVKAAEAIAAANPKRINLIVHDAKALTEMGAGGILAVSKGSDEPPYLIHLIYKPVRKAKKRVAIVGKGITFDSGGLSIKSSKGMQDMKIDMAGCAAMLGAMQALVELAPDVEVHGISAVCENMPSGKATRPGDIARAMSGATIEILDTDAEGRVTLADALTYATRQMPDFIVDLATLTGSCMVALGEEVAGLFSTDRKLAARLIDASRREGELLWELPIVDEYKSGIKSTHADYKNIGSSRYGDAIMAALFLREFIGEIPWAHLDIAGPAYAERETVPHQPLGATGFGVRTLLEFIQKL